jgi:hypothetical protein
MMVSRASLLGGLPGSCFLLLAATLKIPFPDIYLLTPKRGGAKVVMRVEWGKSEEMRGTT